MVGFSLHETELYFTHHTLFYQAEWTKIWEIIKYQQISRNIKADKRSWESRKLCD